MALYLCVRIGVCGDAAPRARAAARRKPNPVPYHLKRSGRGCGGSRQKVERNGGLGDVSIWHFGI
jgi:hypothetical protein